MMTATTAPGNVRYNNADRYSLCWKTSTLPPDSGSAAVNLEGEA